MIKQVLFPLLFLILAYFVISYDEAKEIIAGISIFIVGIYFMEEGFKIFSGGLLERILEKFTSTISKAILNGFLITSIVQSSSLVSVILISFLGASLIGLEAAIGVILGSSLGSSSTAWLITLFGLKIKISHYAMPIIAFGIFFRFSKNQKQKGFGNILLGLGFIFLGISYMINGFYLLKESVDLSLYSLDGFAGMLLFGLIGSIMTFIVQSSSASITIIIIALSSSQIIYLNAICAVIGGKFGSIATTMIGSFGSNSNSKRLAFAQFILNLIAVLVGIIFLYPFLMFIDLLSQYFNITNNVVKFTIFVTIFNLCAVLVIMPFLPFLINKIKKMFVSKVKSWSRLKYLDNEALESSRTIIIGLRRENSFLFYKTLKAIRHQLGMSDEDIYWKKKNIKRVRIKNAKLDKLYKDNIKILHNEIIDFSYYVDKNLIENDINIFDKQKIVTKKLYKTLKFSKNLHINIEEGIASKYYNIKEEYHFIKDYLSIILKDLQTISSNTIIDDIDKIYKIKTLQQKLNFFNILSNQRIEKLFDRKKIDTRIFTIFIKDISDSIFLCQNLIDISMILFVDDSFLLEDEDED